MREDRAVARAALARAPSCRACGHSAMDHVRLYPPEAVAPGRCWRSLCGCAKYGRRR